LKLYACPSCTRVFYLSEGPGYLCGRVHPVSVWEDGKRRRFVISEKTEANRPPWPIPELAEERELLNQDMVESWLTACEHPEDEDYMDTRRHFGYGALGARHLSREEVTRKYQGYVLVPVDVRSD
jgi:hypothetical protein